MALINCPDCSLTVSDQAKSCLNCGRPIKKSFSLGISKKIRQKYSLFKVCLDRALSAIQRAAFYTILLLLIGAFTFVISLLPNSINSQPISVSVYLFTFSAFFLLCFQYILHDYSKDSNWQNFIVFFIVISQVKLVSSLISLPFVFYHSFFSSLPPLLVAIALTIFFLRNFKGMYVIPLSLFMILWLGYFIHNFFPSKAYASAKASASKKVQVHTKHIGFHDDSISTTDLEFETVADAAAYSKLMTQKKYLAASKKAVAGSKSEKAAIRLHKFSIYKANKKNNSQNELLSAQEGTNLIAMFNKTSRKFSLKELESALNAGCDLNAIDSNGWSILMLAISKNCDLQIISRLIEAGADVNAFVEETGVNVLMTAIGCNADIEIIEKLINAGAHVNAMSKRGWSSLTAASACNVNPEVIRVLLNAGANIDSKSKEGQTPLMCAAGMNSNPNIVRVLLASGANARLKCNKSATALDYAKFNKKLKMSSVYNELKYATCSPKLNRFVSNN